MENETDESLITYMGFYAEERETATAATAELFRRHSRKMTAWCIKNFLLYRQNHEELVMLTFEKALNGAAAFLPTLTRHAEPAEKTKHIQCWLYQILRRTCIDAHRSESAEREQRSEIEVDRVEIILDPQDSEIAEVPSSRRVELTRQFVETLDDRSQAIFYNTMQYYDPNSGTTIMPESVLIELCDELSLNPISLRTRRSRLLTRLKQFIVENE